MLQRWQQKRRRGSGEVEQRRQHKRQQQRKQQQHRQVATTLFQQLDTICFIKRTGAWLRAETGSFSCAEGLLSQRWLGSSSGRRPLAFCSSLRHAMMRSEEGYPCSASAEASDIPKCLLGMRHTCNTSEADRKSDQQSCALWISVRVITGPARCHSCTRSTKARVPATRCCSPSPKLPGCERRTCCKKSRKPQVSAPLVLKVLLSGVPTCRTPNLAMRVKTLVGLRRDQSL